MFCSYIVCIIYKQANKPNEKKNFSISTWYWINKTNLFSLCLQLFQMLLYVCHCRGLDPMYTKKKSSSSFYFHLSFDLSLQFYLKRIIVSKLHFILFKIKKKIGIRSQNSNINVLYMCARSLLFYGYIWLLIFELVNTVSEHLWNWMKWNNIFLLFTLNKMLEM